MDPVWMDPAGIGPVGMDDIGRGAMPVVCGEAWS